MLDTFLSWTIALIYTWTLALGYWFWWCCKPERKFVPLTDEEVEKFAELIPATCPDPKKNYIDWLAYQGYHSRQKKNAGHV